MERSTRQTSGQVGELVLVEAAASAASCVHNRETKRRCQHRARLGKVARVEGLKIIKLEVA